MNEQQFERYTNGLTALAKANRQSEHDAAHRLEVNKTINKTNGMVRWVVYVCHPHMASRHRPGIRSGWTCIDRRSSLIDGHGALEERN